MKRYDNGELITKSRMEDEEWYGSYYEVNFTFENFFISKFISYICCYI